MLQTSTINMDDVSQLLDDLHVGSEDSALAHLDGLIAILEAEGSKVVTSGFQPLNHCDREAVTTSVLSAGTLSHVIKLLRIPNMQEKAAQFIAELAKDESVRSPCVDAGLMPPLLALLKSEDQLLVTQACRALGNVCFDNDSGRNAVDEEDGIPQLIELMKANLDSSAEGASKLRMVAAGFLLNLTNTHENLQAKAVSLGAMELLDSYLKQHNDDENLCQMALLCVGSLADSEPGKEQISKCEIAVTIGKLLDTPIGIELQDTILELLAALAESDAVKLQLASSDLKLRLIQLLRDGEKMGEEDGAQLIKLVSDLIVLLLTGDESMEVLYCEGEGPIFKESLVWLKSSNTQLQMSGALAIGNFARNDAQCCRLVEDGITDTLLSLLGTTNSEAFPTLQHGILSALRNLAIPAANKGRMLKCGLLDVVVPFRKVDMMAVQFKLLGLLRMIVDKQESAATYLGTNQEFVEHLIQQCGVEDHAGVKGEANRLTAWIVKNSRSNDAMRCLVQQGALPFLAAMANAEHAVMQNEALLALTLIATSIPDDSLTAMKTSEVVPTVKVILTDTETPAEILCNTITLACSLAVSDELKDLMKIAELPAIIKKLQKHKDTKVQKHSKELIAHLGKG